VPCSQSLVCPEVDVPPLEQHLAHGSGESGRTFVRHAKAFFTFFSQERPCAVDTSVMSCDLLPL
jgi:hypothetical protein